VFRGAINAGQSRAFSARKKFDIRAQDAGAIALQLNGQTLAPIGTSGRRGRAILSGRDLKKKATGGAH
jgi:hypothetical protein